MKRNYVVRVVNDEGQEKYWAAGGDGYQYWSTSLCGADLFTQEEAEKILSDSSLKRNLKMANGQIFPPTMVHSGIGLCNKKQSGYMTIGVYAIEFVAVKDTVQTINASLNMGIDEEILKKNALSKLTPEETQGSWSMSITNQTVEVNGRNWLIRQAVNMDEAMYAINTARCAGSVGYKHIIDNTFVGGTIDVLADVHVLNSDGTERQPYTEAY